MTGKQTSRLYIRDLNPHIVCLLCAGYLIDAASITECLHTFCKSCIVKYLQTSRLCPICNTKVHETQPHLSLRQDRTLQDIVYKVVPELLENETKQRKEFEERRGEAIAEQRVEEERQLSHTHHYANDELVHICLEPTSKGGNGFLWTGRWYVRCSGRARVSHLGQLVVRRWQSKRRSSDSSGPEIELLCRGHRLCPSHCLKRVWLTHWLDQAPPLLLQFHIKSSM
ncbi:polycomb group RING finger protein 1-like [Ornithodoros turicata]